MHEMDKSDAIVISDIHLGSDVSQAKLLTEFLEKIENEKSTKCLILNGDFFDNMDFRRLKKYHWKVLSAIRNMSFLFWATMTARPRFFLTCLEWIF